MIDPTKYNISIRKVAIEGSIYFEAKVKELPDIAEYGETHEEAYSLALDSISVTCEVFYEKGRTMPPPIEPIEDYSGRITLRLPKSLHRFLAETSEQDSVSLNLHIVNILTYYSGTYLTNLSEQLVSLQDAMPQTTYCSQTSPKQNVLRLVSKQDKCLRPAANADSSWS
ncbi:MAG: toxin-antitoxin system HicB family antitoxin [Deltaproteobacteria bacterium]|nr:toxin-antitoxin system HicB family antitoxin [Deltaproteobacteria bacterium]